MWNYICIFIPIYAFTVIITECDASIINLRNTRVQREVKLEVFATTNVTQCGNITCYNKAACSPDGKACQCSRGYKGHNCQDDFNECEQGSPCYHRGFCENTFGSWKCYCLQGWANGVTNHCEIKKTSNNRKCITGWFGNNCENNCHNDSSCGQNQVCERHGRGNICVCKDGFEEIKCNKEVTNCNGSHCRGLTECKHTKRLSICICPVGRQGPSCSDDVNECLGNPCKNSGACLNTNGSYSCNCTKGWTGNNCEEDVDECSSQPCEASLVCHNKHGSFSCDVPKKVDISGIGTGEIVVASLGGLLLLLLLILLIIILRKKCKDKHGKRKKETAVLPEKHRNATGQFGAPRAVREGFVYQHDKPVIERQVLDF